MINVGPSYISAVEGGRRLPRSKVFWKQISKALNLDEREEMELQEALRRSAPTLKIPPGTSPSVREILFDLADRGDALAPDLLEIIQIATRANSTRPRKEMT